MTARERIDYLLDPKAKCIEIGVVGEGMYADHGGCPSGGVVVKMGYIKGKQCIVVANDATVKQVLGSQLLLRKIFAHKIAMENRLPIIYLVDGVFTATGRNLPRQRTFWTDFRNNAQMSSMGITQISAIRNAGGAYLPIMSDSSLLRARVVYSLPVVTW
jgi:acetyl-CoA carboxylase carboxyltransferase component